MAEKIKITYFNAKAKAELIRLILVASNVDFEDKRIEFEDWPQLKPSIPSGQLPVVQLTCGTILNESLAIARYFAKKYHLAGSGEIEEYKADRAVCTLDDLFTKIVDIFHEKDVEKSKLLRTELNETHLAIFLNRVSGYFTEHDGDFFLGSKPSYADLQLVNIMDHFEESQYQNYPKIVKCYQQVLEHFPKVKEYKATRVATII